MVSAIILIILSSSTYISVVYLPAKEEGSKSSKNVIGSDVDILKAKVLKESDLLEVLDEWRQIQEEEIEVFCQCCQTQLKLKLQIG